MTARILAALLFVAPALRADLIGEVRASIAQGQWDAAEKRIADDRAARGVTPEMLEALSWLGRGAQAAKAWDKADGYARETRRLALEELKKRPLDAERRLPIALGASIEVQAHVMAARHERAGAVHFLERELAAWRDTSIRTRIQKNIHLLSLEGKPLPPLATTPHLGGQPPSAADRRGKPLLLFFWAHWCGDCKYQAPILARLQQEFGPRGLLILGPTQRYGYAARGQEAGPEEELRHIETVRRQHYAAIADMPAPVSEENFRNFGCSTTPTLLLVDRGGVVRLYHPGRMTYEELAPKVAAVVAK